MRVVASTGNIPVDLSAVSIFGSTASMAQITKRKFVIISCTWIKKRALFDLGKPIRKDEQPRSGHGFNFVDSYIAAACAVRRTIKGMRFPSSKLLGQF
jgi:hypothetical protein